MIKKCAYCGQVFTTKKLGKHRMYCQDRCKWNAYKDRIRKQRRRNNSVLNQALAHHDQHGGIGWTQFYGMENE